MKRGEISRDSSILHDWRRSCRKVRDLRCEDSADDFDVNAKNEDELHVLHYAADCGHVLVVKVLLERGAAFDARAKYGRTPLNCAARVYGNNESVFKVLIDNGAVVDAKDTKKGHLEVVQALIETGADVNAKTAFGDTPLKICAYYEGNLEVARALIEKGADVNAKMAGGFTPLYTSSQNGHPEVARALIKAGWNFDGLSSYQVADLLRRMI